MYAQSLSIVTHIYLYVYKLVVLIVQGNVRGGVNLGQVSNVQTAQHSQQRLHSRGQSSSWPHVFFLEHCQYQKLALY